MKNWEAYKQAKHTIKRLVNSPYRERIFEGDPELRDILALTCYDSELLTILADDPNYKVRWSVAGESDTPPEVLDKLSYDHHHQIRHAVAANDAAPDYILARLSNDEDNFVREGVAENPKTPYAVLLKLSKDEWPYVSNGALANKNFQRGNV